MQQGYKYTVNDVQKDEKEERETLDKLPPTIAPPRQLQMNGTFETAQAKEAAHVDSVEMTDWCVLCTSCSVFEGVGKESLGADDRCCCRCCESVSKTMMKKRLRTNWGL